MHSTNNTFTLDKENVAPKTGIDKETQIPEGVTDLGTQADDDAGGDDATGGGKKSSLSRSSTSIRKSVTFTLSTAQLSALTEKEPPKSSCKHKFKKVVLRTRGILLVLLASLQLSLSAYLAKRLIMSDYKAIVTAVARFSGVFPLSALHVTALELADRRPFTKLLGLPGKKIAWTCAKLTLRALFGASAMICQFYALRDIELGDAAVIIFSNTLPVMFIACILLHEPCGIYTTAVGLLSIIGVVVVSRPPFLFGGSYDNKHLVATMSTVNEAKIVTVQILLTFCPQTGIGFAIGAMLLTAAANIMLRVLKDVHFSVVNMAFGTAGITLTLLISGTTGELFARKAPVQTGELFELIFLGVLTWSGMCCLTLAYHFECAGAVSVVRSIEIVMAFCWQMISGKFPDAMSIVGAVLVILSIFLVGFHSYIKILKPEHRLRKKFWFVLK